MGPGGTVAELLWVRVDDEAPGLLFEDERYTWREVVAAARQRATAIDGLLDGSRPPHVGVLLENTPEYLFWMFGAALAGAVVVGINPTRRGHELALDIDHTDCQVIVSEEFLDGLRYPGEEAPRRVPLPSDTLLLTFTSGSTGAPKAVVCTQGRLARIAHATPPRLGIDRETVAYLSMPLFHSNSVMAGVLPALRTGAAIALRRRFSASGFLPDVRRFGATYFNYVGRTLAYILETPERPDDRDNPLQIGFGSEASPGDLARFSRRFGCRLIDGYGSSEGGLQLQRTPDTPSGALGLPPPGVEAAVLDPDTGVECRPGVVGEIVGLNTAKSFEGYYKNAEADAQRVRDGVYWTGDLGYRDDAGFFWFAGRSVDWLRVDGENFAAAPIERLLVECPGVAAAVVYAVPDTRSGDRVMAALELDGGPWAFDPTAFDSFLTGHPDLGTKWSPTYVRLLTAPLPVTATNKLDKKPLRAEGIRCSDPVWWKPARADSYRPLTPDDLAALDTEAADHRRPREEAHT